MPTPKLDPALAREAFEAYEQCGRKKTAAAKSLGLRPSTFDNRLSRAFADGMHLSAGARRDMDRAGLNGLEVDGGYTFAFDDEGNKVATLRWSAKQREGVDDYVDRVKEAFNDLPPSVPVEAPDHIETDSLAFLPHADVHVGMRATEDQTGGRGYNRKEAEKRFKAGVSKCVFGIDPCHTALIVNMGDMMHSNDDTDMTPRSKHKLKTEGSHAENLLLSVQLTVYKIDLALQRHQNVIYRGIPGNHDPNIPAPMTIALQAHYRNEPRVTVVLSENEFWQENWGNVFLSGHHGHGRKAKDVCSVLPGKFAKAWGRATEWHYFTGHLHNYSTEIIGSVRHHQLPAVCSIDTHAAWSPYLDTSGMMAMVFNKRGGFVPSIQVSV